MLKTNSKAARQNIRRYIVDNATLEGYTTNAPQDFPELASLILSTFRNEKYSTPEDFRYYHNNELSAFADWCAGLCGILDTCYYYNRSAVDDLGEILEESTKEKAQYTESQAENELTRLIYRELTKGAAQR